MALTKKQHLRKEKIAARNALSSDERSLFSHKIVERLVHSSVYQNAQTIMIYRAMSGEVNLNELENISLKLNKTIVYPRCISKTEMIALVPRENDWIQGAFGIWEPNPETAELIQPEEIDLVICPCTVFDKNGGRIGMGAGYYDRYLEKCTTAHVIAVAFEIQKTNTVPMDRWDRPMEIIFTEANSYF